MIIKSQNFCNYLHNLLTVK